MRTIEGIFFELIDIMVEEIEKAQPTNVQEFQVRIDAIKDEMHQYQLKDQASASDPAVR